MTTSWRSRSRTAPAVNRYTERTNWRSFVYACVAGIVIAILTAKTVLAWIIFSGTLAPV